MNETRTIAGTAAPGVHVRRAWIGALLGLVAGLTLATVLANNIDTTQRLELVLVDRRFQLFAEPAKTSPDLAVVTIDEPTMSYLAVSHAMDWPFERRGWGEIVSYLRELHARALILDVAYSDQKETRRLLYHIGSNDEPTLTDSPSAIFGDAATVPGAFISGNLDFSSEASNAGNVVIGVFERPVESVHRDDAKARFLEGRLATLGPYLEARLPPVRVLGPAVRRAVGAPPGMVAALVYPEAWCLAGARAVGRVSRETERDVDGAMRRFSPVVTIGSAFIPSLAVSGLAVANAHNTTGGGWEIAYAPPPVSPWARLPEIRLDGRFVTVGSRSIPTDEKGRTWVRWRGDWTTSPELLAHVYPGKEVFREASEVLDLPDSPRKHPLLDELAGKTVLLGFTAQGDLSDYAGTPFGSQPGVFWHASALDTMLSGDFLAAAPRWLTLLLITLLPVVVGSLVLGQPQFSWQLVAGQVSLLFFLVAPGIVAAVGWLIASAFAFRAGWILDITHTELAIGLATLMAVGYGWIIHRREAADESRKKEHIRGLLTRTFGKDVAGEMIAKSERGELKLGGEKRVLTLYFSDIAGFTTISEKLPPEELVGILNEYLTRVTELFEFQHGAYVDKYIGDAVMATWGAKDPATDPAEKGPERACLAALDAIRTMDELSVDLVARGLSPLRTRIGINTGPAVAAWIGHINRLAYTSLGDTVNLASRLEGANKHYGTVAMLGPDTYEGAKHVILGRELDLVKVKGKKIPVRVYELMGRIEEPLVRQREIKRRYEAALALFRARQFEKARVEFLALAKEYDDPPSRALAESCEYWLASPPPPDWDGWNELHEK